MPGSAGVRGHPAVVRLGGQLVHQLLVVEHGDERASRPRAAASGRSSRHPGRAASRCGPRPAPAPAPSRPSPPRPGRAAARGFAEPERPAAEAAWPSYSAQSIGPGSRAPRAAAPRGPPRRASPVGGARLGADGEVGAHRAARVAARRTAVRQRRRPLGPHLAGRARRAASIRRARPSRRRPPGRSVPRAVTRPRYGADRLAGHEDKASTESIGTRGPSFRSAVVPAAGLGTRFLPTTKTVPKELLPVVDTPGIELVAAEAAKAGAERLVIVISPGKDAVAAYFADTPSWRRTLEARGKDELLEKVRRAHELIKVRDRHPGRAAGPRPRRRLRRARPRPRRGRGRGPAARRPRAAHRRARPDGAGARASTAAACCARSTSRASRSPRTGCSTSRTPTTTTSSASTAWSRSRRRRTRRRPSPRPAATCSTAAIFDALERITPGAGGELQLTDAVALLISEGHPVHVVVHRGGRHDLGNPGGYSACRRGLRARGPRVWA